MRSVTRATMRVFAHEASLSLDADSDPRAPGAAITVELCGHRAHAGKYRWPRLAKISGRSGDGLALSELFAADATDEREVRRRIARALRLGLLERAPRPSSRTVLSEGRSEVRPRESPAAARLAPC